MSKGNTNLKIENVFKVFLITWQGEGYPTKIFLDEVQRNKIFDLMPKEEKDELKQSLVDISQDKNLINNLYEIIKRKNVLTLDDFNLKLNYANILKLTNKNIDIEKNINQQK